MKGYTAIYKDKIAKNSFGIADFKVLFLTTTDKRIDYMIHNVFDEHIAGDIPRNVFWFSTFDQMARDKLYKSVLVSQVELLLHFRNLNPGIWETSGGLICLDY